MTKQVINKVLLYFHVSKPYVIKLDKNLAYPIASKDLKKGKRMPVGILLRQIKHLNNIIKQDHHFIKMRVYSMSKLKSFRTVNNLHSQWLSFFYAAY
ncbi:hypothetical protein CON11_26190 [Priestia megaterium]|nr:hypothetical protein CON11_26190 [Priestia megaterium]